MELQLQSLCLPFLRVAALLRQHLYRHEMPEISAPGLEFVRLVYYLELVTDSMDWDCFNASKGLCFIPGTEQHGYCPIECPGRRRKLYVRREWWRHRA